MSDEKSKLWTVLLPWDEVLAYGGFRDRLASALVLRLGLDPQDVRKALEENGVPQWMIGKGSAKKVAGQLAKTLECDLPVQVLEERVRDLVVFRVAETALLDRIDPAHRVVVVGDAPEELAPVLEAALAPVRKGLEVYLSHRVGAPLLGDEGLTNLLKSLEIDATEAVLASALPERLKEAETLGLAAFEIRERGRRLVGMLSAWIAARTPSGIESDAGEAEGVPGAEGKPVGEAG